MIDLLGKRKSIRSYSVREIEPEKINILKKAVLLAPSSKNNKPWEFVFTGDKELLIKLSKCKKQGSTFLEDAALGVVFLADEKKSDVWIEDCSIAAIFLQLTAESLGLGSCWIQLRKRNHSDTITSEEYIRQLLKIPAHLKALAIIALGYPKEAFPKSPDRKIDFNKIHNDTF